MESSDTVLEEEQRPFIELEHGPPLTIASGFLTWIFFSTFASSLSSLRLRNMSFTHRSS